MGRAQLYALGRIGWYCGGVQGMREISDSGFHAKGLKAAGPAFVREPAGDGFSIGEAAERGHPCSDVTRLGQRGVSLIPDSGVGWASGIAMLGDAGHFVSLGRKRVTALTDDGAVHISVAFAAGEAGRTLFGYASGEISVSATNGHVDRVVHSPATGLFSVHVQHGGDGSATIAIGPAPSSPELPSAPSRRGLHTRR